MAQKAVGLIEAVGWAACLEAADTALKTANVNLIGIEKANGGGRIVARIEGDVASVQAACDAAVAAANKVNTVFAYRVLARPAKEISKLLR
ncbi:MAG: BMC domain-containing protein [Limnochordia bacterium]|nr:BMC domain-containing protein [Limnochordia bacterium]